MPDFGYDGDNFVIERATDAPRNWRLLTDFVYNKDKYEWLQNHLLLRKLRQRQIEEDEKKRQHVMSRKQQKEKEKVPEDKKNKFIITAKEMKRLDELKRTLHQQASFMQRFKMMNQTQQRNKKNNVFGIASNSVSNANATTLNVQTHNRRTLIER